MDITILIVFLSSFVVGFISNEATHIFDKNKGGKK